MTRNGTVMNRWSVSSERLPVSGSCGTDIELVSTATQVDVGRPGPVELGGDEQRVLSGVAIETVAPGSEVPSSVYVVVVSSTSTTAVAGWVTETVGGLVKRRIWMPRYAPNARMTTVSRATTTMLGEKVRPWRGAAIGFGTTMAGATSLGSPRSCRHWSRTSSGSRPR